jgi:hypothetical protein
VKEFLNIFFLLFLKCLIAQNPSSDERKPGFQFNLQGIGMVVGNSGEIDTTPEEHLMEYSRSKLFGINLEVNYRFDEYWIVGLGTGYETINKPSIDYVPVYLSLRSSIGDSKINAPIFRLNIGTHFGDLSKNGILFRTAMGYRMPLMKEFCVDVEGIVSYQALRKEFDSQPEVVQYYNMLGFGIGVGFEL